MIQAPGVNVIKQFVRNLQPFVKSYSACPWQAFPAKSNKHLAWYENSIITDKE
jgi:hypothetical protein